MADLVKILERIQFCLDATAQTATAACNAAGKPDAIRNIRKALKAGKHYNPTADTMDALAHQLKTTPEYLLYGKGIPPVRDGEIGAGIPVKMAKVVGVTAAGAWFEFEDFENEQFKGEEIPARLGQWAGFPQEAYLVKGDSMDAERICDGDFVIATPYFDARQDITDGDVVVVERVRNSAIERTVKVVEVHGKEIHFCPRSNNPRYKPIVVKKTKPGESDDGSDIRLVGLVIGVWVPRNYR